MEKNTCLQSSQKLAYTTGMYFLTKVCVERARKRMIDLSTTYCGLIIEKEDMVNSINEEYIKQVHEDRLSRMLANDLIEVEDRWVFYDDE